MLPSKTHLPPGPWTAKGNRVVDGYGRTIATVFYPYNAVFIAEWLAELPRLAEMPEMAKRVEELESELKEANEENEGLQSRLDALESNLD